MVYLLIIITTLVSALKLSHGLEHVFEGRAEDVLLLQALEKIPFVGYYLGGVTTNTHKHTLNLTRDMPNDNTVK